MSTALVAALLAVVWLTSGRAHSARTAWRDWRGTMAKIPGLRRAFYASARRAAVWLLALAALATVAARIG